MLFLFRKDRFLRTARVAAAALLLLSTSRSLAEGSSSAAIVVADAGQPPRFEIARDELHFKDRTGAARVQRLPAEPSVERLRSRPANLAATGMDVKLVIYPTGQIGRAHV